MPAIDLFDSNRAQNAEFNACWYAHWLQCTDYCDDPAENRAQYHPASKAVALPTELPCYHYQVDDCNRGLEKHFLLQHLPGSQFWEGLQDSWHRSGLRFPLVNAATLPSPLGNPSRWPFA